MQTHDLFDLAVATLSAGLAGFGLGLFFFASLWWMVRRTLSSRPSALWHLGSLLVRMGITLLGFYAVGAGSWERLLACLAGFLVARFATTWLTRVWERRQTPPAARATAPATSETGHAPQP